MQSLLRWSIENSADSAPLTPAEVGKLDPGVIDVILGKSDAELMKEALTIAMDEKRDDDDRVQALDDFEMLVEQIDNANNLENLGMWQPLQELLNSPESTNAIKTQTVWILGTALQNNPSAQHAYLKLSPIPSLLAFLSPSTTPSAKLRSKAVYTLSGLLKHNVPAVAQLDSSGGWPVLRDALEDSDITVRRKIAFLLNALLIPLSSPTAPAPTGSTRATLHTGPPVAAAEGADAAAALVHPNSHASMEREPASVDTSPLTLRALRAHGVLDRLVISVVSPVPYGPDGESEGDVDLEEKVMQALFTYVGPCGGELTAEQKTGLREYVRRSGKDASWGLTSDEAARLRSAI